MINRNSISGTLPQLQLHDTVDGALRYMTDFHVMHLPVVAEEKYLGLISEDNLLDASDSSSPISSLREDFRLIAVPADHHIIETVAKMSEYQLTTIPVVEEDQHFLGSITEPDLLKEVGRLIGAGDRGALIVLGMDKQNFSFSELSRLVETNDAFITQLNTFFRPDTGELEVTIRVNKFEVSDILATLQRYEYQVKYYFGEERFENQLKSNYEHLLNYLNI